MVYKLYNCINQLITGGSSIFFVTRKISPGLPLSVVAKTSAPGRRATSSRRPIVSWGTIQHEWVLNWG